MRFIEEIKAVGLRDWCWFVFVLRRNEFSCKLDIGRYWKTGEGWQWRLERDRQRAHEIDMKLMDLGS